MLQTIQIIEKLRKNAQNIGVSSSKIDACGDNEKCLKKLIEDFNYPAQNTQTKRIEKVPELIEKYIKETETKDLDISET